jgi:hypothetical protein
LTYTIQDSSGDPETAAHTIGALLQRSWDKTQTTNVLPAFLYDQTRAVNAPFSDLNDYVKIDIIGSGIDEAESALDNSQGTFDETITITVNSVSPIRGKLIEKQIMTIFRDNYRKTIYKSDGSSDSGIKRFIPWPFPKFQNANYANPKSYRTQVLITLKSLYTWSD